MIIKRNTSNNEIEYKMYKDLNGLPFIPRLISSIDGIDTFEVKEGIKRTKALNKEELIAITVMLKMIENQSRFKLGGECYINNNIKMENIVFNENNTPIQILDWSKASLGKGIENLVMLIDSMVDLNEERYTNKEALKRIIDMARFYNSCKEPLHLGDEMKKFYETRVVEAEACCMERDAMMKLDFVEKYYKDLNLV